MWWNMWQRHRIQWDRLYGVALTSEEEAEEIHGFSQPVNSMPLGKQALTITCLAVRIWDESVQASRGHEAGEQLRLHISKTVQGEGN